MKYYCIGNKIGLVKLSYSNNFFENLPYVGIPIFGKFPITQEKMAAAFENTDEFILCKNLNDAKKLRLANITIGNTNVTPEFFKGAIAAGYPSSDHAIYEVEIDDNINVNFSNLTAIPTDELSKYVSDDLHIRAVLGNDRRNVPNIDICCVKKTQLTLVACHYFSLENGEEEIANSKSCNIM